MRTVKRKWFDLNHWLLSLLNVGRSWDYFGLVTRSKLSLFYIAKILRLSTFLLSYGFLTSCLFLSIGSFSLLAGTRSIWNLCPLCNFSRNRWLIATRISLNRFEIQLFCWLWTYDSQNSFLHLGDWRLLKLGNNGMWEGVSAFAIFTAIRRNLVMSRSYFFVGRFAACACRNSLYIQRKHFLLLDCCELGCV